MLKIPPFFYDFFKLELKDIRSRRVTHPNYGRPLVNLEAVVNAIVKILRTGSQWNEYEGKICYKTAYHYFRMFTKHGSFIKLYRVLLKSVYKKKKLQLSTLSIDASLIKSIYGEDMI